MIPPPKYQTNTGAILTQPGDIGSIDSIFEATHKLPEDIQFTKAYEDYLKYWNHIQKIPPKRVALSLLCQD